MDNRTMSVTDEIYSELVAGLEARDLDWTHFMAKYSASKGPLYNAIGRFFKDMEPRVRALTQVQAKLDEAGLRLDSLDQRIKEADGVIQAKNRDIVGLEQKQNTLKKRNEVLDSDLEQKRELLKQLEELEKQGFDEEKLTTLYTTLAEIASKRGLKPVEAVNTFFAELQDYDAGAGFEQEVQRLETITATKKLETEKWTAEAESLSRRYKDLAEAVAAVQNLTRHGVKVEQIVSWNKIVSKLSGPEELQDKLGQYKSMAELLTAQSKETEGCEKKITELGAQIKALDEHKGEIEGAIKSLSTSGVKHITEVGDKAMTGLKSLSATGAKEVTAVGRQAMAEVKTVLAEIRAETKRLADLKAEAGKLERELMYARYFTTGDEAVLKSFPREVVITFLERALVYCQLNQLNPKVRVPDGFHRKYMGIQTHAEVDLIGLIRWAEAGLAGASQ